MKKITKLTPQFIKQIIVEEKQKIKDELNAQMLEEKKVLLQKLRLLKKINEKQNSHLNETKDLNSMRKKIIKSIRRSK